MTSHNLAPLASPTRKPLLVPNCDRCGCFCDVDKLYYDRLGWVCPRCWWGRR